MYSMSCTLYSELSECKIQFLTSLNSALCFSFRLKARILGKSKQ